MIIHSRFILPKTVGDILSDKEMRATGGFVEQVSDTIKQIYSILFYLL